MKLYFAPLEGITGYVFRQAHWKYYGGPDKYFAPFVSPNGNKCFTNRERNDILPEHNAGMPVVPQILTNSADAFINTANQLEEYGYHEVNLNLGCPSGTVVTKYKGAGFLAKPEELDQFLYRIFESCHIKISVKTRIGKDSPEEFPKLMDIFNRYPLEEIIIHPRCQIDMYRGNPDMDVWKYGKEHSKNPVCYNGDIRSRKDYETLVTENEDLYGVMLGRGLITHPDLTLVIKGENISKERFCTFHNEILQGYRNIMSGDRNTLFKMKELWFYWIQNFPESEKIYKKIKKATNVKEYEIAVNELFRQYL